MKTHFTKLALECGARSLLLTPEFVQEDRVVLCVVVRRSADDDGKEATSIAGWSLAAACAAVLSRASKETCERIAMECVAAKVAQNVPLVFEHARRCERFCNAVLRTEAENDDAFVDINMDASREAPTSYSGATPLPVFSFPSSCPATHFMVECPESFASAFVRACHPTRGIVGVSLRALFFPDSAFTIGSATIWCDVTACEEAETTAPVSHRVERFRRVFAEEVVLSAAAKFAAEKYVKPAEKRRARLRAGKGVDLGAARDALEGLWKGVE
jgi:hypothetical protein